MMIGIISLVGLLLLLSLGVVLYMWKEAHSNNVVESEIVLPNFPKGFGDVSLFFISDVHRRVISSTIISTVKKKAEIVIIGGDLAEKGVPLSRIAENITLLSEIGPVYFVWGNNDYELDYRELDALLLQKGVKVLDNTAVTFESDLGDKLVLLGVDDISKNRDRLDLALHDAPTDGFRVLISHNPSIVSQVKKDHNIELVLSGHTHGGQIRLGSLGLYRKGGLAKKQHTTLLISNGYGTTKVPLRLGAKSETHLIVLKNGEEL